MYATAVLLQHIDFYFIHSLRSHTLSPPFYSLPFFVVWSTAPSTSISYFYQPRSGRSTFDVGQKKEEKEKTVTLVFFAIFAFVPGIFSSGPIIWVSMDLPGPQYSYLRQFGPWGQILGPKGPLARNFKIAIFSQNITIWVSMDLPGPQHSYLRQFGPRGQILGPRPFLPRI